MDADALRMARLGSCEICGVKPRGGLVVDHDHKTGDYRGMICTSCNTGLGKLGDTLEGVMRAARYLSP